MLRPITLLALLLAPAAVRAEPLASCTPLFAGKQAPALLNPKLADRTTPLCYRAYAVLYQRRRSLTPEIPKALWL